MKKTTREKFNTMTESMAASYGVPTVKEQFAVAPTIAQQLKDKIVEQSTFLGKINVVAVDEVKGENILGAVTSSVTGRTDTSQNAERAPRNLLGMTSYSFELHQTNVDVGLPYKTMDAWAKFPDLANRYTGYVQKRMASDMELIGWNGTSAAATTDPTTNTLLQDVNKGWMQYMRDNLADNILTEGATTGEIRFGENGDFTNLDVAVNDLLQGIPAYMRDNLVALIGADLIAHEKAVLFAALGGTPTEKTLLAHSMVTFGGLPWETPSNFPARGLVITSYDNLSIYQQEGSWRRQIMDNPKKDRIEDYSSRNEGYVVETPEKFVAWEFANVKLAGEWTVTEPSTPSSGS